MLNGISNFRTPKDWDFIMPLANIPTWVSENASQLKYFHAKNDWKFIGKTITGMQIEIEVADANPSSMWLWENRKKFTHGIAKNINDHPVWHMQVANNLVLSLIKRSHLYWAVHWQKNIEDYHVLKLHAEHFDKQEITPELQEFYEMRLAENTKKFGKNRVNLNMSNDDFFKKSQKIGRRFVHDDIHEAVKYGEQPLYKVCKVDQDKANLSEPIFRLLDRESQLNLVREETMVIALERQVIPKDYMVDYADAYLYALSRICTNLTAGWFRDFAIENYLELREPNVDYVALFKSHFKIP